MNQQLEATSGKKRGPKLNSGHGSPFGMPIDASTRVGSAHMLGKLMLLSLHVVWICAAFQQLVPPREARDV